MKLYDCTTAPSPRRVRFFMAEKGIDIELVPIDLGGGEHLGPAFQRINPDCTVPVLELDDGTRITEIVAICQYLEETHPEPRLMGQNPTERALVTMWTSKIENHGLGAIAEMFRNRAKGLTGRALTGPHGFEQIPALVDRGRTRLGHFFDRLNTRLAESRFIAGDEFTIADITAFVAVEFAAWSKVNISDEQTHLNRWFDEIKVRPSVRA